MITHIPHGPSEIPTAFPADIHDHGDKAKSVGERADVSHRAPEQYLGFDYPKVQVIWHIAAVLQSYFGTIFPEGRGYAPPIIHQIVIKKVKSLILRKVVLDNERLTLVHSSKG